MRLLYIKLINFAGIAAAMRSSEFELSLGNIDKSIIQLFGPNKCGKTVVLHEMHMFSSLNFNGDERNDLPSILPGVVGMKNIVYEVNGVVYNITHTFKPTGNTHTVTSSIICDGEELNPSGGVTIFNNIVEKIFGINKYKFQFTINGTQLMSFGSMSTSQRKNAVNKSMGIDIYDKINRLSTDDYRYTNKLITSLSNTKEYLLTTYGAYENLCRLLYDKRNEYNNLSQTLSNIKSQMDGLSGKLSVIQQQNVAQDLYATANNIQLYEDTIREIGLCDSSINYDKLIDEQIRLNNMISELRNKRDMVNKDIDILYNKQVEIGTAIRKNKQLVDDYNEMVLLMDNLKQKISNINVATNVTSSSSYIMSLISIGQAVNGICKDIMTLLNKNHLKLFSDIIESGIDFSAFLIQEGSILMDTEKEKGVVTRIRNIISSINGEEPEECIYKDCIYRKTYNTLNTYFGSYQSATSSKFTTYDIEQFDLSYKNFQTIKRLISLEIPVELKPQFDIINILHNMCRGDYGINIKYLEELMEDAAKIELRNKYINQLSEVERTMQNMTHVDPTTDLNDTLDKLSTEISMCNNSINNINNNLEKCTNDLSLNDKYRMMLTQIQHMDINELRKRQSTLQDLSNQMNNFIYERGVLESQYNDLTQRLYSLGKELEILDNANTQYINTTNEIEKYQVEDSKYKIISEATSSTKGKPIISIRDVVTTAIVTANQLLNVMYNDGEIELTKPTIDETDFALPFRCMGSDKPDIRYGSQSESSMLSLALSLSLSSQLTPYNIALIDEIDAYLDEEKRDSFVLMLQELMMLLKIDQLFIISHNMSQNQYEHLVHTIDISSK